MLLPSYMCRLNNQEAPSLQKAFPLFIPPSLHWAPMALNTRGPQRCPATMQVSFLPFCPPFWRRGPHPYFISCPLLPTARLQLGSWVPRDSPRSMTTDWGAAAEQLEQMKPRPNVNCLWQLLLLGLSCSPGKAKGSGHKIPTPRPTNHRF